MILDNPDGQAGNNTRWFDSGLLLEDRQILLPWGARLPQLAFQCAPSRQITTLGWEELDWHRPLLLNGLRARLLQVIIYPYGWFDSAWVWLQQGEQSRVSLRSYEHTLAHLHGLFGEPDTPGITCCREEIAERAAWERPGWRINLLMRAGSEFDAHRYACVLHCCKRSP